MPAGEPRTKVLQTSRVGAESREGAVSMMGHFAAMSFGRGVPKRGSR